MVSRYKTVRAKMLHRAFWAIYFVSTAFMFLVFGLMEVKSGLDRQVYGFLATVTVLLFQESLFLYFIYLERMYVLFLGSALFYASLAVSNVLIIGILAAIGLCGGVPRIIPDMIFSGWGIVGGNLGCALVLAMAFGISRKAGMGRMGRSGSRKD